MASMVRAKHLSAYEHQLVDQLERMFRAAERRQQEQEHTYDAPSNEQKADAIPAHVNRPTD